MGSQPIPSFKNIMPSTEGTSWIHRWESRIKLISCIIMVFGLVFLNTPKLLIISYILLTAIILSMGLSIKEILKKTSLFLPFLVFMSIPILIGGGLPPSEERVTLVLLLTFKGLNSLSIMFIMFFSQSMAEILNGLAYMKLPSSFITILFLSWRYVFILGEKFIQMHKALISRLFKPGFNRRSFKAYGEVMGGMLVKSIDTSDKVYIAMASRGFDGTMPTTSPRKIKWLDIFKSTIMVGSVILLKIIEKWWL